MDNLKNIFVDAWETGIQCFGLRLRIGIMVAVMVIEVGYSLINRLKFDGLAYGLILLIIITTVWFLDKE